MGIGGIITTTVIVALGGITGYRVGHLTPLACPGYRYVCDGSTPAWAAFPSEFYDEGGWQ